jgi:aminoglycoside phosphotransferase (APT) family kinase protein
MIVRRIDSVARGIVMDHPETLADWAPQPVILGTERTTARGAVVKLGRPGGEPWAILKIATTPEGKRMLDHETEVLGALQADERLGGLRGVIPRPLARGTQQRRSYRLDSVVRGRSVTESKAAVTPPMLRAALEAISTLHTKTATTVAGGPELAERWVDAPLRALTHHARRSRGRTHRFERLRDELHGALDTGRLTVSWIHGDYWLGNVLFSDASWVGGIVDWDASAPLELPFHDLLHLLLYTRRLVTGRELGELVSDQIRGRPWSAAERELLGDYWTGLPASPLSERHIVLLYWLRQAAAHARQQSGRIRYKYGWWEQRNVLPVLGAV